MRTEEDPRVRDLIWKLTGWDCAVARDGDRPWLRPAVRSEGGEWILDAGRRRLTITPPWPRRARAMRAEQARWTSRIHGAAAEPIAQASPGARTQAAKRAASTD